MESSWRRACKDTEHFRQSAWSFWGLEVGGAAVFGVLGTFSGFLLIPKDISRFWQFAYPSIGGAVGIILGFVIIFGLIFAWNLFRAPYRQRDEALEVLASIPGSSNTPITPEDTLWIIPGMGSNFENNGNLVEVGLLLNCSGEMNIEAIEMEIQGERVSAKGWRTHEIGFSETYSFIESFEIPKSVKAGNHIIRFLAFGNGKWWASKPCALNVKQVLDIPI